MTATQAPTGLAGVSYLARAAFVIIILGNLLNFIAFSTTSWGIQETADGDDYYIGLWKRCRETAKGCDDLVGYAKVWFGMVQGFATVGFIGVNACFVLIICYVFLDRCRRDREVSISAGFIGFITAMCWIIAVIIFGYEFEDDDDVSGGVDPYGADLGFSFVLAVISAVMEIIAGGLMVIECFYKQEKHYRPKKGKPYQEI